MSQKLPVDSLEWLEDTSHFNEDFIRSYNEENKVTKNPKRSAIFTREDED